MDILRELQGYAPAAIAEWKQEIARLERELDHARRTMRGWELIAAGDLAAANAQMEPPAPELGKRAGPQRMLRVSG